MDSLHIVVYRNYSFDLVTNFAVSILWSTWNLKTLPQSLHISAYIANSNTNNLIRVL
jgi:hypothetical protein